MAPTWIIVTALLVFLLVLAAGRPIALALLLAGAIGVALLRGVPVASDTLGSLPYSTGGNHGLIVIPLFILLGALAFRGGIAQNVFTAINVFSKGRPSLIPVTTILSLAGFAAVTGSSVATVGALGPSMIPEMTRRGFRRSFAAGVVANAGTLGILIPPSIAIVVYGVITGERIGALLLAGILPGVVSVIMYVVGVAILVRSGHAWQDPAAARVAARARHSRAGRPTLRQLISVENDAEAESLAGRPIVGVLMAVAIFLVIMGGIFMGLFTVTESAAIGVVAAGVMYAVRGSSQRGLARRMLGEAALETVRTTGMLFLLIIGGAVFTYFLVASGVPTAMTSWLSGLPVPPWMIVALILLAMIPLGMFLEGMSILLITIPLAYPVVTGLGFDGIWFGILVIKMIEVGLITPPVGLNAFVASKAVPGLRVEEVFKGLLPWYAIEIVTITILFVFPDIILAVPNLMR